MVNISQETSTCITFEKMNLINDIRSLWLQLALWMRSFIISSANDSGDLAATTGRLYQVPKDFYNTLRIMYGRALAEHFLTLMTRYIVTAVRLMDALKNNNQNAINARTEQWYQIADEIAAFLAQNPIWDESYWRALLYQNISMTINQMLAVLKGYYEREISIYERINTRAIVIADYMSKGILQ